MVTPCWRGKRAGRTPSTRVRWRPRGRSLRAAPNVGDQKVRPDSGRSASEMRLSRPPHRAEGPKLRLREQVFAAMRTHSLAAVSRGDWI
jgi:hypothetical protein